MGEHRPIALSASLTNTAKRKPGSAGRSEEFNANEYREVCFDRAVGFGVLMELACGLSKLVGEERRLHGTS